MPTPDDPRSRRAISALSHGKPKPYRRPAYSEEPYRLSRVQIVLLALGATAVAGLVLTVTVIAQEHANAMRGKDIIAAALPASSRMATRETRAQVVASSIRFPAAPTPPVLDDAALHIVSPLTLPMRRAPVSSMPPPLTLPRAQQLPSVQQRATRPPAPPSPSPVVPAARAIDPDVELIARILHLTPAPVKDAAVPLPSACTPAAVLENLCVQTQGMRLDTGKPQNM